MGVPTSTGAINLTIYTDFRHSIRSGLYAQAWCHPFGLEVGKIQCKIVLLCVAHSYDELKHNVLVTPDNRAVLTDFGGSRMDSLSSGYSSSGCRVSGTLRWQAVELFPPPVDGDGPPPQHTFETDIWAFGMTVYVRPLPE